MNIQKFVTLVNATNSRYFSAENMIFSGDSFNNLTVKTTPTTYELHRIKPIDWMSGTIQPVTIFDRVTLDVIKTVLL